MVVWKLCDDHIFDLFKRIENTGISLAGYTFLAVGFISLLIERDIVNQFTASTVLTLAMNPQYSKNNDKTAILHS